MTGKRFKIQKKYIDRAWHSAHKWMDEKIAQKGDGSFISTHETLGVITEEYHELIDAVRKNFKGDIELELLDVIIGAVFGIACIEQDLAMEWIEQNRKDVKNRPTH